VLQINVLILSSTINIFNLDQSCVQSWL